MQQWIQILVFLLVIGGPILGRFLQWLGQQKRAKDRERAVEAARLEALRTGRPLEEALGVKIAQQQYQKQQQQRRSRPQQSQQQTQPAGPSERMQELARRRQEQLQELRRRQQAARQQHQQQTQVRTLPSPTQPGARGPGVPKPPHPGPQRIKPGQPVPQRVQARQPSRSAQPPQRAASVRPVAGPPRPAAPSRPEPERTAHERFKEQAPESAGTALPGATPERGVSLLGQPMTPADWRRFIVARELLEPPLALRDRDDLSPPA